ncbi:hypothetical protein ABC337_15170 [Arthrobacter sp. 1P04PC]|uniref:hypothetical protein n=1 Tax=unclassified Arthrobacter TaxID=235627 RepID=UPI0039A396D0
MESSLIPRPFSPTNARRRSEENAREAERRTSARNASSSTIGAGGKLDLAGDINVMDGGVVRVIGQGFDDYTGVPYEVTSRMTTYENEGNYGTYQSPALEFSSAIFGESKGGARIYSRSGNEIWIEGTTPDSYTSARVGGGFYAGYNSRDTALGKERREAALSVDDSQGLRATFTDTQAGTEAGLHVRRYNDPTATLHVGHFTWRDTLFARLRTKLGGKLWLESNSDAGSAAVVMDGAGNIDLQTTGKLTNNGSAIGGAVASVAGKTGAVTLVPADVGGLQTALDSKGPRILKHWERSGSTSTPDSTVWGPGVITADPNVSTDVGLLTMLGQDLAQIRDTGTYAISVGMRFPAGVTATNNRSAISVEPMSGPMFCKGPVIQTDDQGAGSIPNIRLQAGQQFHIYIVQISGATRVMSYTIRVTKISD